MILKKYLGYVSPLNKTDRQIIILLVLFDMILICRRQYLYWSDSRNDQLFRSNLDGSAIMFLANATHEDIGMYVCMYVCVLGGMHICWVEC